MTAPETAAPAADPGARRDALVVAAIALLARLAVVAWAAPRIPPAADGTYYQTIAERIARGLGYTWLWPDGAVTYAAHYPVGYPAMVGGVYALAGAHPGAAMALNAALGALAAFAAHRLAARAAPRRIALAAGLLVALHPGLLAYTPALMTEGVTAALLAAGAAVAASFAGSPSRGAVVRGAIAAGAVLGVATLVRPQSIVLAPLFALAAALAPPRADNAKESPSLPASPAGARTRRALLAALLATLSALAVCAPWTARNCVRMKRCALVSVNGGWNLLIGADEASTGAWSPIKVPEACREVYDEAEKDQCFGREARRYIREHPGTWLSLVPRKLAATFDYAGAGGWYLHEANPGAFPTRAKEILGAAETLYERVLLVAALVWSARKGPRRPLRLALAIGGALGALSLHAWIGYAALTAAILAEGRALLRGPFLPIATALTVGSTLIIHAVFFGAGRYSLVVFPLVSALGALAFSPGRRGDKGQGEAREVA
ncbi:MAG: glycosyltransferase family 39 protein [Byssovorax sp.]